MEMFLYCSHLSFTSFQFRIFEDDRSITPLGVISVSKTIPFRHHWQNNRKIPHMEWRKWAQKSGISLRSDTYPAPMADKSRNSIPDLSTLHYFLLKPVPRVRLTHTKKEKKNRKIRRMISCLTDCYINGWRTWRGYRKPILSKDLQRGIQLLRACALLSFRGSPLWQRTPEDQGSMQSSYRPPFQQ